MLLWISYHLLSSWPLREHKQSLRGHWLAPLPSSTTPALFAPGAITAKGGQFRKGHPLIGRHHRMKLGYIPSGWLRDNGLQVIRKGAQGISRTHTWGVGVTPWKCRAHPRGCPLSPHLVDRSYNTSLWCFVQEFFRCAGIFEALNFQCLSFDVEALDVRDSLHCSCHSYSSVNRIDFSNQGMCPHFCTKAALSWVTNLCELQQLFTETQLLSLKKTWFLYEVNYKSTVFYHGENISFLFFFSFFDSFFIYMLNVIPFPGFHSRKALAFSYSYNFI